MKELLEQNTTSIVKASVGPSSLFAKVIPVTNVIGARFEAEFTVSYIPGENSTNFSRSVSFYFGSSHYLNRATIPIVSLYLSRKIAAVITSLDSANNSIRCSIPDVTESSDSYTAYTGDLRRDTTLFMPSPGYIAMSLECIHTYPDEITILEHYALWRITK